MKYPIILVLSEGKLKPLEIINNIRKLPQDDEKELIGTYIQENIMGYVFNLTTKYYKTQLYLVPFENDITLIPPDIQDSIECMLIYFDSDKRTFSNRIPIYAEFLKENNIELGILLCDKLYDDSNEGITYKEARQQSRFLDVVELERMKDENDEDEDEDDTHDPVGYDEVLQALRSFLWSNVNIETGNQKQRLTKSEDKEETTQGTTNNETQNSNSVEAELEAFEKLLTEVMTFKNSSATWSRNERLAYMEKFANKFERLIGDGDSSSEEN